jgi:hypothetical protein
MALAYLSNTFKTELETAEATNKNLPVIIMQTASTLVMTRPTGRKGDHPMTI